MEGFTRSLKTKGVTLDTDSSAETRLSQRPSQPRGSAYEDFGSDFASRSSSRASYNHSKHAGVVLEDFSDDELDFLSASSRNGSVSPTKPKKRKVPVPQLPEAPLSIAIDYHQTKSDYRPTDLKKMKIPKKSSATSSSFTTTQASQSSHSGPIAGPGPSSTASAARTNGIVDALNELKRETDRAMREEKCLHPLREHSPNQDRAGSRKSYLPDWDNSDEEVKNTEMTPRPPRPVPRPAYNGATPKAIKPQTAADMQPSTSQDRDNSKLKAKVRSVSRSQSVQHITGSPLVISDDDDVNTSMHTAINTNATKNHEPAGSRPGPKRKPRAGRKPVDKGKLTEYDPIGALFGETDSPPRPLVQMTRTKLLSDFPMPSPLSSPVASRVSSPLRKSQPKSHRVVLSENDGGSEAGGRSLRPFPMDTQVLENLKPVSSAKRAATGSDAEGSSIAHNKRARRHPHDNATDSFALHNSDSDTDLDDIFLDPSVDPKTLCPWCDERLPSNPTPHLVSLMDVARRRSYADDRPTNPLGLRAPPAVFVSVCQRHRFERIWVPRARKRGWPTRIDWGRLSGRVGHLEGTLKTLVDDIDEDLSTFALKLDIKGKGKGQHPRRTNEFWQEVVKNVREQGSRQATGVRGQFLHFNKTQPGYYGELGYVIIHQTLCNLFPPASFDPAAAQPLTPEEFIAHILVPEAAANLIMEDLGLSRVDALKTLRESVEYGVAMFPADEGEGGRVDGDTSILTAGERMIMERARARRKELEEEERMEEEQERRAHGLAPQTDTEPEVDVDIDHAPPSSSMTRQPKPRPMPKRKPPSSDNPPRASVQRSRSTSRTLESDGGVIDLSSDTGGSTGASRIGIAKRRRKAPEGPPSSKSDAPTDTGATTPRSKPKPRPKPRPRAIVRIASQSDSHNGVPSSDPQLPDEDEELLPLPSKPVRSATRGTERTNTLLGSTSRPKPRSPTRTTTGHSSPPDVSGSRLSRGGTKLGSCLPLQLARERRRERGSADGLDLAAKTHDKVKGKQSEGWLPNLRANGAEEFSTDEEDQSQPGPLPKAIAVRRTASRPSNGRNADQWDWLLSDGSSAGSRTSSFAN